MFLLLATFTLASAQDWCIDEHTGMMSCLSGTDMWPKYLNASQCQNSSDVMRSGTPDWLMNRQENSSFTCPAYEDLEKTGAASSPAYCILESMGFLWPQGGVRSGKIKRNIAKLDSRVLHEYSGGNSTVSDPSGFLQCMNNSYVSKMIPEVLSSCKDNYPNDRTYRKQIKRFMKRWAAFDCLHELSSACEQVWRKDRESDAWAAALLPEKEPLSETEDGSQCCDTISVEGKHGAGVYVRNENLYRNGRPVYFMAAEPRNWCIFYEKWWKVEYCDWVTTDRYSRGYVWSEIDEVCPDDIGSQWRYYSWEGGSGSGAVDPTAIVECALR